MINTTANKHGVRQKGIPDIEIKEPRLVLKDLIYQSLEEIQKCLKS